jgi:phosphoribosyl 1,2-cyclic phosphodiesterase
MPGRSRVSRKGFGLHVHCWGTRGSLPRALTHHQLRHTLDTWAQHARARGIDTLAGFLDLLDGDAPGPPLTHGGDTTCTEVGHDDTTVYVDLGTGLRAAGDAALARGQTDHHVFLTHLHWDHVAGLPLFAPVYRDGHRITVHHVHPHAPEHVRLNFNGVNFPVTWDRVADRFTFRSLRVHEPLIHGPLTVTPFHLDHPGQAYGYRFDAGGRSVAVGVDNEYRRHTRADLAADLPYYQNLDLLLFDAQYTPAELADRSHWGHCTPRRGVDLALREGIGTLLLSHHDPSSDDAKLRAMGDDARAYAARRLPDHAAVWADRPAGPEIAMAYDGLRVTL